MTELNNDIELTEIVLTDDYDQHLCCICLEPFATTTANASPDSTTSPPDYLTSPCCNQPIHVTCLSKWLIKRGSDTRCPTCRQPYENLHNVITVYDLYHTFIFTYCMPGSPLYRKHSKMEIANVNELLKKHWGYANGYEVVSLSLNVNYKNSLIDEADFGSERVDIESGRRVSSSTQSSCINSEFFVVVLKFCFFIMVSLTISLLLSQLVPHETA